MLLIGVYIGWTLKSKQKEFFPNILGKIKSKFITKGIDKNEEK